MAWASHTRAKSPSAGCGNFLGTATSGGTPTGVDLYADGLSPSTGVYLGTAAAASQWSFAMPASVKDNQLHAIYAVFTGTTVPLTDSPQVIQCNTASTGYQYSYSDSFTSINTTYWTKYGRTGVYSGGGFYDPTGGGGGALIATSQSTPSSTPNYEAISTLAFIPNGTNFEYVPSLRATGNPLQPPGNGSTYFAVTLSIYDCPEGGVCTGYLQAFEQNTTSQKTFFSTSIPVGNNMIIRSVVFGSSVNILVNGKLYQVTGISETSGNPGVGGNGLNAGNGVAQVQFGPLDTVAPSSVNPNTNKAFTIDVYPNSVDVGWQGAVDNPGNGDGSGVVYYQVARGDGYTIDTYDAYFYDPTVQPSTIYSYSVTPYDFHGNAGPSKLVSVMTPAAGNIYPRRTGVERIGSYWGGAGEQIDLLSGNLNFSIPLVTAQGRNGLTATFALTHNSQNWRNSLGADRILGADTGYGFGWQLMLGSLLPVWGGDFTIQYYLYTDSSGAQYRLDQTNGNGIWGSVNSVYARYDSNNNLLYFPSGNVWVMGCTSAGAEQDAGTLYPTVVEDSNGNQIIVTYMSGAGAAWNNSSSRIATIEDVRAPQSTGYISYQFSYITTPGQEGTLISYLSGIANFVGTIENYAISISPGQPLYSPDSSSSAYTTGGLLESVSATGPQEGYPNLGYSWQFTYELPPGLTCSSPPCLGDGSLTEVQFPQGGYLQWTYAPFQYDGPTFWEVSTRTLQSVVSSSPPAPNTYTFSRPSVDVPGEITVHSGMTLQDATGPQKVWSFLCTNPSGYSNCPSPQVAPYTGEVGLLSGLQVIAQGGTSPMRDVSYQWTLDGGTTGNAYVGTVKTTLDAGRSWAQATTTTQTLDTSGNTLTMAITDYNSGTTRTYTNTYLNGGSPCPSSGADWVCNRLLTSTVKTGNTSVTLVQNIYDTGAFAQLSGPLRESGSYPGGQPGNVTTSVTPGHTVNTQYYTGGTVASQNDGKGHSISVTTSSQTNFTLPDQTRPKRIVEPRHELSL